MIITSVKSHVLQYDLAKAVRKSIGDDYPLGVALPREMDLYAVGGVANNNQS